LLHFNLDPNYPVKYSFLKVLLYDLDENQAGNMKHERLFVFIEYMSVLTSGAQSRFITIDQLHLIAFCQSGVVAHACNPATWRLGSMNGLRAGFLGAAVLCSSGVRAKFGVNMVNTEESEFSRLVKEERTGPGWKYSRQKLPRQTVVG